MYLKKNLGKRIQEIRKQNKLTQEKLAEIVCIDPKSISQIEVGNNYPSAETLETIAKALNVNIYELFIFDNDINYDKMKDEIIQSLCKKENILTLYKSIKGIKK